MGEVVGLSGQPIDKPDPDIIAMLKRYLEMAQKAEITAVAIAIAHKPEHLTTEFCVKDDYYRLHSAVSTLQWRLSNPEEFNDD